MLPEQGWGPPGKGGGAGGQSRQARQPEMDPGGRTGGRAGRGEGLTKAGAVGSAPGAHVASDGARAPGQADWPHVLS